MRQVAFRLDGQMIGAVEERIERDGITLSTFMRKAVREALLADPGLSFPALKAIALFNAETDQVEAFRQELRAALGEAVEKLMGKRREPAIPGAPESTSDWGVDFDEITFRDRSRPVEQHRRHGTLDED